MARGLTGKAQYIIHSCRDAVDDARLAKLAVSVLVSTLLSILSFLLIAIGVSTGAASKVLAGVSLAPFGVMAVFDSVASLSAALEARRVCCKAVAERCDTAVYIRRLAATSKNMIDYAASKLAASEYTAALRGLPQPSLDVVLSLMLEAVKRGYSEEDAFILILAALYPNALKQIERCIIRECGLLAV